VVYGIICQSDGFISAHSEPGKGSTFKIHLPVVAPSMREFASPRPASKPVHGGSETLLVVEDADALRQSEVEFLSAVGYTVLSAANGKEALDQVRARAKMIDLVITDVVMPKMSGPVLVANLTSLRPDIKVLFVSGYSNETVQRKGVPNLTRDFLPKPFLVLRSLAGKIREVLDRTAMAHAARAAGSG
jgi:two-component system, cell cycle sensor histidine kinase and response regulator CckA